MEGTDIFDDSGDGTGADTGVSVVDGNGNGDANAKGCARRIKKRPDACLEALVRTVVPLCEGDPCGVGCALALSQPPPATGCCPAWRRRFLGQTNLFRRRVAARCATALKAKGAIRTRAACGFSAQLADSPCFAAACQPFFLSGAAEPMSAECKYAVINYCAKVLRVADDPALFADTAECMAFTASGVTTAQFTYDLAADCDSYYAALPNLAGPLPLSIACLDYLQTRCLAQGNCTCFMSGVDLRSLNSSFIQPCLFAAWNWQATVDPARIAATVFFALCVLLHLVLNKLAK